MTVSSHKVISLAREWIGTPYQHQVSLKGVGADCLGLIRGIYRELYNKDPEGIPNYSADWAEARHQETMLLGARCYLEEVSKSESQVGDVLVFRLRAHFVAKHAGLLSFNNKMIHAIEQAPVSEVHLSPWWQRRIAGVFRFPSLHSSGVEK
ncbi:MAG: NlpC/P60 family protein [Pseudomonadota bacterium]